MRCAPGAVRAHWERRRIGIRERRIGDRPRTLPTLGVPVPSKYLSLRSIPCLLIGTLGAAACAESESPPMTASTRASLDDVLRASVDAGHVPGVVAMVVDRDSVLLPDYLSPFDDLVPTAREGESSGESAWALQARVIRALQRVVQRGPGRSLVVAQGGSLSAALRCVVGAPLAARTRGSGFPWATPGTRDSSSRHGSTAGCSASSDMARINDPPSKTRERT
jgi:hypothetical protein